jgi:hypothetical protein
MKLSEIEKEHLPIVAKVPDIPFFSAENLDFFSSYANKSYRKDNEEHKTAGQKIKDEIYRKTNVWARLLNLDEWEIELDSRWQVSGNFKEYSWVRIYKPQDKGEKVFFTIGVDGGAKILYYKLDCQRKQYLMKNALTKNQVVAFDRVLDGTKAVWNEISRDELSNLDWERLRDITVEFIGRYEFLYQEAIKAVQIEAVLTLPTSEELLQEFPIPLKAFDKIPDKAYNFKGVVIDYDAENKNAKIIGDGGEELVIKKERKNLGDNGLSDLVEEVKKVKDGEGYDILSYDLKKNRKFIEVKTTTGINTRPFLMTDNEWEFMRQHSESYHLYRIYDYDKITLSGKFFCLSGSIEELVYTKPKQIEIFLKTKK